MAKRPTLPTISATHLSAAQVNTAFDAIKTAFDNTLSLDGSTPNSMNADIDMNSNDLLNVGLIAADDITIDGTNVSGVLERAEDAADEAQASAAEAAVSAAAFKVGGTAAMQILQPSNGDVAFVSAVGEEDYWVFRSGDYSTEIAANDPRYLARVIDPTGLTGAWILAGSVWDGHYSKAQGHNPTRIAGRIFAGANAGFGGEFDTAANMTGLDAQARSLHNWAFRDGGFVYDDHAGSMAIIGHTQSSREAEWPGSPANNPIAIGVSGFAINDMAAGFNGSWGGYFDAVQLNSGFTVGSEHTVASVNGPGVAPTPFNLKGTTNGGVSIWTAIGAGLDTAWTEYDRVTHSRAYQAYLTSYDDDGGIVAWANNQAYVVGRAANDGATAYVCLVGHTAPSTGTFSAYRTANPSHWQVRKGGAWSAASVAYVIGDLAVDAVSGNTFICAVAHTSSGSVFSAYRAANTTHWRQNPGGLAGLVVGRGAIAENSAGSDLYPVMVMPDRHMMQWYRDNAGTAELSAFIWNTRNTAGSAAVGITFGQDLVSFTATNGIQTGAVRIGGTTNFATLSRGSGAADTLTIANPGASVILFQTASAEVCRMDSAGFKIASGKVITIGGAQVVGARETGWAADTGTAKKTANATYSGTASAGYVQAEMTAVMNALRDATQTIKAMKDTLIAHGLMGT